MTAWSVPCPYRYRYLGGRGKQLSSLNLLLFPFSTRRTGFHDNRLQTFCNHHCLEGSVSPRPELHLYPYHTAEEHPKVRHAECPYLSMCMYLCILSEKKKKEIKDFKVHLGHPHPNWQEIIRYSTVLICTWRYMFAGTHAHKCEKQQGRLAVGGVTRTRTDPIHVGNASSVQQSAFGASKL